MTGSESGRDLKAMRSAGVTGVEESRQPSRAQDSELRGGIILETWHPGEIVLCMRLEEQTRPWAVVS